jgi:hypothetical protein
MARNRPTESSAEGAEPSAGALLEQPPVTGAPPTPPTALPAGEQPPAAPADPEMLTPNEWAHRKGLLYANGPTQPWVESHAAGFHSEADVLHGWSRYAAAYQAPADTFRLTEADYDAARKAAAEFPALPAHKAALPPNIDEPELPEHLKPAAPAAAAPTNGA